MVKIDGKIIVKVPNTKVTEIGEMSSDEKERILMVEQELNGKIASSLYRKYGIAIRVHI